MLVFIGLFGLWFVIVVVVCRLLLVCCLVMVSLVRLLSFLVGGCRFDLYVCEVSWGS